MPFTAAEIASYVHGRVTGDGSVQLKGMSLPDTARAGDLTFAENADYFVRAEKSAATAILVDDLLGVKANTKVLISVANARVAFAKILALLFPAAKFEAGVHPTAIIAKTAKVDPSAHIGPWCVIMDRVSIGPRVVLQSGNYIGPDSVLEEETNLFPNVVVYARSQIGKRVTIHSGTIIGSDGFGYVLDAGAHRKIPQIGNAIIHDDVEIGANVTVDCGALGSTIIGKGTKIDNLVQVGHNVVLGEHCIVISQVGIAGSNKIGNYVTLAGQAGIVGHLSIGDRVVVGAQSGVTNDIPAGEKWLGSPAIPGGQMKRIYVAWQRMPELLLRVAELEREVERLRKHRGIEPRDG